MGAENLGETFYENKLQIQADKCKSIISEVRKSVLEQGFTGDKLNLVGDIEREIEVMEDDTQELFDNPDRVNDINRHLRRILLDIAEDFDYEQKLYNENNNLQDDISTLFYWFELIVKPNLSSDYHEVTHDYAIHECRSKRNDVEHGRTGDRIRPDIIGIGILSWYALHEILMNWERAQSQAMHGHLARIDQDTENEYGFICKLNYQDGAGSPRSITQYEEAEEGNKISFEPDDVISIPTVGDIVTFSQTDRDGTPIATDITIL